jgi:rRNA pseudouridine-1189 N-methylase Emg1 (Nep1/Mra1 family)
MYVVMCRGGEDERLKEKVLRGRPDTLHLHLLTVTDL